MNFTSDGLTIAAVLTLPQAAQPESGFPAVVLAQGLSGVKNVIMPDVARALAEAGIATLAFDYRGCGESEGDPQRLFPLERVTDICNAAAFLRSQPLIDASRPARSRERKSIGGRAGKRRPAVSAITSISTVAPRTSGR
jgi:dipeptidyl aminopeptidase/acylaminoacyl peptidase